jgi:hypothetical protein
MEARAVRQAFWAGLVYWFAVYGPAIFQWILCTGHRSGDCWGFTYQFRLGLLASWDQVFLIYVDKLRLWTFKGPLTIQVLAPTYLAVGLIYFYCLLGLRRQRRVPTIIMLSLFTIDRLSVFSLLAFKDYLGIVLVREILATLLITYFLLGATVKKSIRPQSPSTDSEDATTTRERPKRPFGVTLIAIFTAISVVPNMSFAYFPHNLFLGYVAFVFAILYIVLTYGMWTLRRWAHTLGIAFAVVEIVVITLKTVFFLFLDESAGTWIVVVLSIVIFGLTIVTFGLIIFYLLKRETRILFGKA